MLIYKDVISEDELVSDSYPMKVIDDIALQFESKNISVDNNIDESKIGGNASAEEAAEGTEDAVETKINIVHSHSLEETWYKNKKEYLTAFKGYVKALAKKIEETNPDRVAPFKSGVEKFLKEHVLPNFDNLRFFIGPSMNPDAMTVLAFYPDGAEAPLFWFFKDGLVEEKF